MPLYMDRHYHPGTTWEQIQEAHASDLALQGEYGIQFLTYWFDEQRDTTFCLVSAPSPDVISTVHSAAHGGIPNDVVEVDQDMVLALMGRVGDILPSEQVDNRPVDRAFRAIMFTDLVGYTELTTRLGDEGAIGFLRQHNTIVRGAVGQFGGRTVKHTGDGFMVSFNDVRDALDAAIEIQRATMAARTGDNLPEMRIRVGLSAGEPIVEGNDLFGTTVNLASRLCDAAGPREVFMSREFTDALDSTVDCLESVGAIRLKGFDEPQIVARVAEWKFQVSG